MIKRQVLCLSLAAVTLACGGVDSSVLPGEDAAPGADGSVVGVDGGLADGSTKADSAFGGPSICTTMEPVVMAPATMGGAVAVTVDLAAGGCVIAPDFAGSNYEAFPGWGADTSMSAFQRDAFANAGTQLFRFPGGEPAEWFDLLMTGKCADNSNSNWNSPAYAALWSFAQSANVHSLMLQTNPTPQYCGTGSQDSSGSRAAALANDVKAHQVKAVYEIGNEPDISKYFGANGGQSAYIDKFIEQANAIHGVDPAAEVYGPATCGLGANCSFPASWDSGWIGAFLGRTGNLAAGPGKGSASGVSFHVYWHPEWGYSDLKEAKVDKYGFALYWENTVTPYLRAQIAKYDSRPLPIVISEISVGNGIANDASQAQNAFTVLETLDIVGAFARSGLRSFQWFDANAAGPSDYWMMTNTQARPIYYSFALWSHMGTVALDAAANVAAHDVASYATRKDDGSLQVLLVNKTSSSHDVTLTFKGANVAGRKLVVHTVAPGTPGSDTSVSILYDGVADPAPSALPAGTSTTAPASPVLSLPAYSAAVALFSP